MIISPMFSCEIIATEYQKCAVSFYQRCKKRQETLSMPDDGIIVERQFLLIAVFRNHYFIKN